MLMEVEQVKEGQKICRVDIARVIMKLDGSMMSCPEKDANSDRNKLGVSLFLVKKQCLYPQMTQIPMMDDSRRINV